MQMTLLVKILTCAWVLIAALIVMALIFQKPFLNKNLFNEVTFSDILTIIMLVIVGSQVWLLKGQIETTHHYFKIQQRPLVAVSEIQPKVLGNKELQSEIEEGDELLIDVLVKNIGLSTAFVEYIKVHIYYAAFYKGVPKLFFYRTVLLDGTFFSESVLIPNQITTASTMVDAKDLMSNIRNYTTSREAPIYIEYEIKYSSTNKMDENIYWHNGVYQLLWPAAQHITIYSNVIRSNEKDNPLHLHDSELLRIVANIQNVKPVLDALKDGGEGLDKIVSLAPPTE